MRKDLENYILVLQNQYNSMIKASEEANQLCLDGKMSAETVESIQNQVNLIASNYNRVLYCRYLYNLPPKFIQKIRQRKLDKQMKEFIKTNSDLNSVVEEGKEALEIIDNKVNEVKDGRFD